MASPSISPTSSFPTSGTVVQIGAANVASPFPG
jgi:hypothetical protein